MLKYDQLFNSSARNWEAANSQNQDIQRWPGHCLGGAVASILLNEPTPAPGSGMTQDELKALWAELGENHLNHQIGDYANEIPAGPPRPGSDDCDASAPRFHGMLETAHPGRADQPCWATSAAFPPAARRTRSGTTAIGKYTAKLPRRPRQGPRAVRLEVEVLGNSGSCLNGQDDKPRDRQLRVHPGLRARRPGRRDQPLGRRLDLGRRRGDVSPAEHPPSGRDDLAGPQPV